MQMHPHVAQGCEDNQQLASKKQNAIFHEIQLQMDVKLLLSSLCNKLPKAKADLYPTLHTSSEYTKKCILTTKGLAQKSEQLHTHEL